MRPSSLYALFAVTIVAVIAAVLVSLGGGTAATDPRVNRPVLAGLTQRLGDVARITDIKGDVKTTLVRRDGVWRVEEKYDYPADAGKMKTTLFALAALRYAEPKTAKPSLYSRLDVEDPGKKGTDSALVTLSDSAGKLMAEMIFGKRRYDIFGGGNDGIYVRKPGEAQSWLANGSLTLPSGTLDWVNRQISMIKADTIQSAKFISPDGATVAIGRAKKGDKLALAGGVPKGQKLKSDDALADLARGLDYFSLDDVMPATAVPFPDKGVAQAVYTTFDGMIVTIYMIERDELTKDDSGKDVTKKKYWVKLIASGTGQGAKDAAELNKRVAAWAYAVPDYKANTFKTRLADLIEPAKSS
ncbi:MAG TPA: DUF4340 domain-containing protein [Stellaceae bacterium]|nr:DUF4340 domain-containing protein [Stellaceae bacterium]